MKKGLILTLSLIMILCLPIFSACGENSKAWLAVNTELSSFLSSTENEEIISGEITYNTAISSEINNSSSVYSIIDTYENLLEATFTNIENFYGAFSITPIKNSEQASNLCDSVINNLTALETQIETFNTEKQAFITNVANNDNLTNIICLEELRLFKISFGKLLEKANNLQNSFTFAYSMLYGPITTETNISSNNVKNAVVEVYGEMLNTYIKYAVLEFNYLHPLTTTNFYSKFLTLENQYKNHDCITINYEVWLDFYELYASEKAMFLTALNGVNLTENNTNAEGLQKEYLNKISSFVNTNAGLFVDITIELLY